MNGPIPSSHPTPEEVRRSVRVLGNLVWLVLIDVCLAMGGVVAGILYYIFIVTIPFRIQSFKIAGHALRPFGWIVVHRPDREVALECLANAIWILFGGVSLALGHLIAGICSV